MSCCTIHTGMVFRPCESDRAFRNIQTFLQNLHTNWRSQKSTRFLAFNAGATFQLPLLLTGRHEINSFQIANDEWTWKKKSTGVIVFLIHNTLQQVFNFCWYFSLFIVNFEAWTWFYFFSLAFFSVCVRITCVTYNTCSASHIFITVKRGDLCHCFAFFSNISSFQLLYMYFLILV